MIDNPWFYFALGAFLGGAAVVLIGQFVMSEAAQVVMRCQCGRTLYRRLYWSTARGRWVGR